MGSLFRSEDMALYQIYLQAESAYSCVSELGELGIVQFKDLNCDVNAFQRKFVNEIRRCEEMERQLRYFERELKKENVEIYDNGANPEAPAPRDMVDLEAMYERLEGELSELNNSIGALRKNQCELQELRHVLQHTDEFLAESALLNDTSETSSSQATTDIELRGPATGVGGDLETSLGGRFHLGYIAGVIDRSRIGAFTRLLWFACHGNVYIRHAEITETLIDPHTNEEVNKLVFMVFFQGDQLKQRVKKICDGFKATLYPCPGTGDERREMAIGVLTRSQDLETVLSKSTEQQHRVLRTIAQNLYVWNIKVLKIKAIYHTLNMLHAEGQNYVAECWIPVSEHSTVQMVLNRSSEESGGSLPSIIHAIPCADLPTYHRTNKFTLAFQTVIDAYGVASYKEVNPAPFSIITFPFLFSVMFGDSGHGVIMLIFALWMVLRERQIREAAMKNEMFSIIYGGRYLILLMAGFSIYSGLLYNDCFSKSFNIFGSKWNSSCEHGQAPYMLDPNDTCVYAGSPYPFGVDPVWQLSMNKISFTNSFKKKISVVFGVAQMTLGVLLGIFNHTYFRQPLDLLCNFLPMILFLMSIFGYMIALIFTKWVMFSAQDPNCAPNILIGFINMFLFKYDDSDKNICSNRTWFPGQMPLQFGLVAVAGVSAIWMLLSKPLILNFQNKRRSRAVYVDIGDLDGESTTDDQTQILGENGDVQSPVSTGHHAEGFDFGEVFIHQAIHTIEFCLGCVSHTASYLRLWALSLAHAQLSEVLWNMVLHSAFSMDGWMGAAMLFVVFTPFACLTIAILLLMEGLSAFLHTLRLHWVEFNSKFYGGDGIPFVPFNFKDILASADD
ncbi:hypothetical protein CAPTEDRAFT_163357 [Capitella teleta]|uniref:V-type proton ATPase subunit a n=1 Tax=Capitella teleta TaxID=283909 RepID=R7U194_CAPTE|nr:hypothetical protein CAPTEDRAFT_163357 [Capitella teleta]|eukprot:ELT99652.1 hypothetical protein CAPTEDRAFT_163357 [Capitella teleta]